MKQLFKPASSSSIQSRLILMAGVFLFLYALLLTLAPAARARTWAVNYSWLHWIGFIVWLVFITFANKLTRKYIPDADPALLPVASLLTGWGLLTIYRLVPSFGIRQTVWLLVSGSVFLVGLRLSAELRFLRRYKYIWLTSGLLITALTIVFGKDPGGGNVHAWLGCCGVYFQPSEPLKLLLIIFLAAYMAEKLPLNLRSLPLLAPTLVVIVIALLLLFIQRDLGTASIFFFLYTMLLYLASGKRRILIVSITGLILAGVAGYFLFDLIRLRVDAWLNPWLDPSGRSYQIVQSLMAVANGGTSGRGPGLGSPGLVPVAISDFIFTSIAEETGLVGSLALLVLIAVFTARAIRTALLAPDLFRRIMAAGLAAYVGVQSILIIGGNIRLLPLTGVTLPFVSYGGSSLLTSMITLLLLMLISSQPEDEPASMTRPFPFLVLTSMIGLGLLALAVTNAWWAVWRSPDLLERTDNARRTLSDKYIRRGSLLDKYENPINITEGSSGSYYRAYLYPQLAPITGYTNPSYGQSGLEASLDPYLRGLKGNPARNIWWDHIVYGQPPPGIDIRLSVDLDLQRQADELLASHKGAIVVINSSSGEILAIASHPNFDPTLLDMTASSLLVDPDSPMLDRAAQGMYPPGEVIQVFLQAASIDSHAPQEVSSIYGLLGFYSSPEINLPVAAASKPGSELLVSPLQMAIASAALSSGGVRPAPRLAMAANNPAQGWVILPASTDPVEVFEASGVSRVTRNLSLKDRPFWQYTTRLGEKGKAFTWSLAGTLPETKVFPLAIVVLLEEENPDLAGRISLDLLQIATRIK